MGGKPSKDNKASIVPPLLPNSFRGGFVRERDKSHSFEDIYEILDEIGQGGICKIFKIEKKTNKIGGSSRPDLVRRRRFGNLLDTPRRISSRKVMRDELDESIGSARPMFYALKVINLALVKEDKVETLKNEVEILKNLDHQNIIKAYETFQAKKSKKLMIVMELCTGGDLSERYPYAEAQVCQVTKQILNALSFMHDNNIAHRDLKLENVMFENKSPSAHIRVIDFGLSKAFSPHNNILTERVGTLYSMSPETMQGIYTSKADLWSLGVCVYMMLASGEKPFEGKTPKEMVAKVLLGHYSFSSELWLSISEDARDFIRKLLVVQPQDRMTARQALHHPWVANFTLEQASSFSSAIDDSLRRRVREGLVAYADMGEFRKLALNVIARKSSSAEIFELRTLFDEYDSGQTGTITMEEFREALEKFDYSEAEIARIFRKIDIDRNNVINYSEFIAATLEAKGQIEEYRLAEAFDQLDCDDSGYISRENLKQILGQDADDRYVNRLIREGDFKNDGRISYEEFLQVFTQDNRQRVAAIYNEDTTETDEVLRRHGMLTSLRKGFSSASNLLQTPPHRKILHVQSPTTGRPRANTDVVDSTVVRESSHPVFLPPPVKPQERIISSPNFSSTAE